MRVLVLLSALVALSAAYEYGPFICPSGLEESQLAFTYTKNAANEITSIVVTYGQCMDMGNNYKQFSCIDRRFVANTYGTNECTGTPLLNGDTSTTKKSDGTRIETYLFTGASMPLYGTCFVQQLEALAGFNDLTNSYDLYAYACQTDFAQASYPRVATIFTKPGITVPMFYSGKFKTVNATRVELSYDFTSTPAGKNHDLYGCYDLEVPSATYSFQVRHYTTDTFFTALRANANNPPSTMGIHSDTEADIKITAGVYWGFLGGCFIAYFVVLSLEAWWFPSRHAEHEVQHPAETKEQLKRGN